MTRKKAQTTVTLQFNPPPDGTYPPRILSPGNSHWLSSDEPTNLTKHLSVSFDGKHYVLHNYNPKREVLVNGQRMLDIHILKDGDYIRAGYWNGVFQADPVASYRKLFYADLDKISEDETHVIEPSEQILKWLVITDKGISFDGGLDTATWEEIWGVCFKIVNYFRWRRVEISLIVQRDDKHLWLASKLNSLTPQEFITLTSWITYRAPFALSTNDMNRDIWPDAYLYDVLNKVVIPTQGNDDLLPEEYQDIVSFVFVPRISNWKSALWIFGGLFILAIIIVLGSDIESLCAIMIETTSPSKFSIELKGGEQEIADVSGIETQPGSPTESRKTAFHSGV